MITMEKWQELIKKWETVGAVYQVPERSRDRLKHFCETALPYLKDKKVLEIGCNAGLFGYCISQVAEWYVGVEPANKVRDPSKKKPAKTDYFKQLKITHEDMPNSSIYNETIPTYCLHPEKTNAFVACFALYHFMNHELEDLKNNIFPNCDTIIIQNRKQDRPTPHNKYKFERDKNIVKFFQSQGFSNIKIIPATGKDGEQKFSEIICLR